MANIKVKVLASETPLVDPYTFHDGGYIAIVEETGVETYDQAKTQYLYVKSFAKIIIVFDKTPSEVEMIHQTNGDCVVLNIDSANYNGDLKKIKITPVANNYYLPDGNYMSSSPDLYWGDDIKNTPSLGIGYDVKDGYCTTTPTNESLTIIKTLPDIIPNEYTISDLCVRPYNTVRWKACCIEVNLKVELFGVNDNLLSNKFGNFKHQINKIIKEDIVFYGNVGERMVLNEGVSILLSESFNNNQVTEYKIPYIPDGITIRNNGNIITQDTVIPIADIKANKLTIESIDVQKRFIRVSGKSGNKIYTGNIYFIAPI